MSLLDGALVPNGTFTIELHRYPALEHYIAWHPALLCIITSETHTASNIERSVGAIRMTTICRYTGEVVDVRSFAFNASLYNYADCTIRL